MLIAFCRVAPSVRLSFLAIFRAGVLPYLVATFTSEGIDVSTATSSAVARAMASDRSITYRRRRLSEQSKVFAEPWDAESA
ncbi:MAG: hypothetical protein WBF03_08140 [Xanthobacteraceae bacterium]